MSYTRDMAGAVCESVAAYLSTALSGSVTVLRGWPEDSVNADIVTYPTLSVEEIPGGVADEPASPAILGDVSGGAVTVTTGPATVALQMDLFAAYREKLDAATQLVEAALANDLPWRPHLYLTATDYDGAPFTVIRQAVAADIDTDSAQRGEWRRRWTLRAEVDRRTSVAMPTASTITATPSIS